MRRSGFGAGAAFPGARIRARGLLVWLGSSHTYWADTLVLPESRCKVGSGADDCVSSNAGATTAPASTTASLGSSGQTSDVGGYCWSSVGRGS
jgi:hypothetical protein